MYELSEKQLQQLGDMFAAFYRQKIKAKIYPFGNPSVRGLSNKVASGKLLNSIKTKVKETPDGLMLEIEYMDYFKYVNLGRRKGGKFVPIKALLDWIKIRGIRRRDEKGRFVKGSQLSLAFAIQKNIHKFGIRRTNIYDKAYDSLEDVLMNPPPEFRDDFERLYNAVGDDVENFITRIINKEIPSK